VHHGNSGFVPAIVMIPSHELAGDLEPFGAVGRDDDRYRDRPLRKEPVGRDHLHDRPVDHHRLTLEEAAHGGDVGAGVGPRHGPLAEGHPAREARPDRYHHPAGRERLERGDGSRLDKWVPEPGYEDRGTEPDALGVLGHEGERDPDVLVQRGRVEEPHPLVAELLGQLRVAHDVGSRREATRDLESGHRSSGQS